MMQKRIMHSKLLAIKSIKNRTRQGGSVMCVRTLGSDPPHLRFSLNCLPNEEEITKRYQHINEQTSR